MPFWVSVLAKASSETPDMAFGTGCGSREGGLSDRLLSDEPQGAFLFTEPLQCPGTGDPGLNKAALTPSLVKLTAFVRVGVGTDNKQVNKQIDV